MKHLGMNPNVREVAFYHRNSSDGRKEEILHDLKLPLNHPDKKLKVVVATVSLGKEKYIIIQ